MNLKKLIKICCQKQKVQRILLKVCLSQLIDSPTRIICNTSILIDRILTNTQENSSQPGVVDTAKSNYSSVLPEES